MKNIFSDYDWRFIRIKSVFDVQTPEAGTQIRSYGERNFYQMAIKFTGATEVFYNNEQINYTEGTVLYLPKEKKDDIPYNKTILEKGNGVCIFFDSDIELSPTPQLIKCSDSKINKLFIKLNNAYNDIYSNVPFDYIAAFYELLSALNKQEAALGQGLIPANKTEPALKYIEEHFCDEFISMDLLAKMCGMTKEYFRHYFKKAYGIAPLQYIKRLKIKYIKSLIMSNKHSLTEIAQLAGFSDLNYFSRFFKKEFGISASEYKKLYCNAS